MSRCGALQNQVDNTFKNNIATDDFNKRTDLRNNLTIITRDLLQTLNRAATNT